MKEKDQIPFFHAAPPSLPLVTDGVPAGNYLYVATFGDGVWVRPAPDQRTRSSRSVGWYARPAFPRG